MGKQGPLALNINIDIDIAGYSLTYTDEFAYAPKGLWYHLITAGNSDKGSVHSMGNSRSSSRARSMSSISPGRMQVGVLLLRYNKVLFLLSSKRPVVLLTASIGL